MELGECIVIDGEKKLAIYGVLPIDCLNNLNFVAKINRKLSWNFGTVKRKIKLANRRLRAKGYGEIRYLRDKEIERIKIKGINGAPPGSLILKY